MKLFTAGPVSLAENVKNLVYEEIGHREEEFKALFFATTHLLEKLFGSHGEHKALVIGGSGTAALESAMCSLIRPEEKVMILSNGYFGERLIEIAGTKGLRVTPPKCLDWKSPLHISSIRHMMEKVEPDWLAMVHSETSTGGLNRLKRIGRICQDHSVKFMVDAMSSLGGEELSVYDDKIDCCISNSNKCVGGLPVLGFVCSRRELLDRPWAQAKSTFYLDLYRHYDYALRDETPWTPQIPLFVALHRALLNLFAEGLEARTTRFSVNARTFRSALQKKGLETFLPDDQMGHICTNVMIPSGKTYEEVWASLRKRGYLVYPGKAHLKGRVVHVGHIGEIGPRETTQFTEAFLQCF